jgi:hypothetical protein
VIPLVFLSFGGVLVTISDVAEAQQLFADHGRAALNQAIFRCASVCERVLLVQRICDALGAEVVISGGWREFNELDVLSGYLSGAGLTAHIAGVTPPYDPSWEHHGMEVTAYLRKHPTNRYAVLDCKPNACVGHEAHFVLVKRREGLTDAQVDAAITLGQEIL